MITLLHAILITFTVVAPTKAVDYYRVELREVSGVTKEIRTVVGQPTTEIRSGASVAVTLVKTDIDISKIKFVALAACVNQAGGGACSAQEELSLDFPAAPGSTIAILGPTPR